MKFKHVRDALRGKDRRIEELEEALRFVHLACEAVDWELEDYNEEVLRNIQEKCETALDKA